MGVRAQRKFVDNFMLQFNFQGYFIVQVKKGEHLFSFNLFLYVFAMWRHKHCDRRNNTLNCHQQHATTVAVLASKVTPRCFS
jgi:hypothetical protein